MKIHGMCLVKNESDIVPQSLKAATEWCDFIYVYDNGSTDGTWEQVLDLAKKYKQVIPFQRKIFPFQDNLRKEIFDNYRQKSSDDDWWCRLDADEIYIDDPRIFLAKIPSEYRVVVSASFGYYFTDKDLALYNQNPSLYADHVPIEQKCRYYLNNWSEPRFFRYSRDIIWNEDDLGWPSFVWQSSIYPVKIWLKHYQYRSPQQIQKRLDTRHETIVNRGLFPHEAQAEWKTAIMNPSEFVFGEVDIKNTGKDWKERIMESSKLNFDEHDRRYILREDLMPQYNKRYSSNTFLLAKLPFRFAKSIIKKMQKI